MTKQIVLSLAVLLTTTLASAQTREYSWEQTAQQVEGMRTVKLVRAAAQVFDAEDRLLGNEQIAELAADRAISRVTNDMNLMADDRSPNADASVIALARNAAGQQIEHGVRTRRVEIDEDFEDVSTSAVVCRASSPDTAGAIRYSCELKGDLSLGEASYDFMLTLEFSKSRAGQITTISKSLEGYVGCINGCDGY